VPCLLVDEQPPARALLCFAASIAAPKFVLNFIKKIHTCFYSSTSGFRSSTSLLSLFILPVPNKIIGSCTYAFLSQFPSFDLKMSQRNTEYSVENSIESSIEISVERGAKLSTHCNIRCWYKLLVPFRACWPRVFLVPAHCTCCYL
jgi:hypothetical protein